MNSAQNHVANAEENLFKKIGPSPDGKRAPSTNHLPNSSDLILNESAGDVGDVEDSKTSNETEGDLSQGDSSLGENKEVSNNKEIVETSDNNLPDTAILLRTDWGSNVYVVGTAHFSEQSQEDVAKVIQAVQPNFVVLELCQSRSCMLKLEEEKVLELAEKMDFKMINETIRAYGALHGVMYLLLLSVSAQITRERGMAPGGEFRRAYKEASNVPGCVVHLGDRPIEITLKRAFASMSWWQSIKFAFSVIFSVKKFDKEEIEKCKNRDYLEEVLEMFGGEFPELKKVFVNERDLFLSYSLITASTLTRGPQGILPNTVVGVVGLGHLPGIQQNWQKIDPNELREVLEMPPPSKTLKVFKFTVKVSLLCLALYGLHSLATKSKISSFLR